MRSTLRTILAEIKILSARIDNLVKARSVPKLDWHNFDQTPVPVGVNLVICYYLVDSFKQYTVAKANAVMKDGLITYEFTAFIDGKYYVIPCVRKWALMPSEL